ncbi:ATP-binding cassette domain-containing protein [Carnobacterium gallinarum]|uniref:ATP-binding cassette domain-containing protein n=1 Tax=Carnobacterium gallinarum TaxID=2749 RepID=UPI000551C86F|nr:ABC transporter ATP-binding protein [Carnobacterium gallinarum]
MLNTQNIINSIQKSITFFNPKLLIPIIIFPILTILSQIFQSLLTYNSARLNDTLDYKISFRTLKVITNEKLTSFEDPNFYDLIQRAEQSGGTYPFSIATGIVALLTQSLALVSYIFILINWKWWTIFVIVLFPLLSSLQIMKISKNEFELFQKRTNVERLSWYYANLLNKDGNIKETKLFGLEKYFLNKFNEIREAFFIENQKLNLRRESYTLSINFISIICTALVLTIIFYEASIGLILLGSLMTYINSVTNVKTTFNSIVSLIFKIHQDSLYIENVTILLGREGAQEKNTVKNKVKIDTIDTIELINLSFKYPRTKEYALKNIYLKINKGNSYSFVGANGSGKTTLVKIIMGFYMDEYEGTIKINDIDLNNIDLNSFRKCISAVFQDFTNYQFSVSDIISITDKSEIDIPKVIRSSKKADAHQFIKKMPKLYQQQIGNWFPGGLQLSGGEWQKLSIAKAFYKEDASLLIFDEPSSALDPITESNLYMKFNELTKKILVFLSLIEFKMLLLMELLFPWKVGK